MAVASAFSGATKLAPPRERLADGRYDWFDSGHDALRFLAGARRYVADAHDVDFDVPASVPTTRELEQLRELRDAVQALIDGHRRKYESVLRRLLARYAFRLDANGGLAPAHSGWDAFIAQRLPALVAIGAHADRLRRCANADCRWAIWDTTKNGTRVWCDARSCGNRMKVRAFRERQRMQRHTERG